MWLTHAWISVHDARGALGEAGMATEGFASFLQLLTACEVIPVKANTVTLIVTVNTSSFARLPVLRPFCYLSLQVI